MVTTISKQYTFEAAHQLVGYEGKCARLHGHSYVVVVGVTGELIHHGSSANMVMDYAELDEIVKPIVEEMDHKFLAQGKEPIVEHLTEFYLVGLRTTAENLAQHIFSRIRLNASKRRPNLAYLSVEVRETAKTTAIVGGPPYEHEG